MTTTVTTRRLTGLKPTGSLHLGNLLGAIRADGPRPVHEPTRPCSSPTCTR